MILASTFIIMIKPYIFFALLPGSVLWTAGVMLSEVTNKLVRALIAPMMIFISILTGYIMLRVMGNKLGDFAVDNVLNKAVVVQQDLKQDYYGGATFDIGEFDPTPMGVLKKAPQAIYAALFRPTIFETRNIGMIMSALENLILLILTGYLLIKLKFINFFKYIFKHHFLFFSVSFSIFFAFSIGLTTSNFGSLVRYKIPAVPFFVASLFIIYDTYKEVRLKKEAEELQTA
jgi:hypothetical protein